LCSLSSFYSARSYVTCRPSFGLCVVHAARSTIAARHVLLGGRLYQAFSKHACGDRPNCLSRGFHPKVHQIASLNPNKSEGENVGLSYVDLVELAFFQMLTAKLGKPPALPAWQLANVCFRPKAVI
jgi:hypothetical protein